MMDVENIFIFANILFTIEMLKSFIIFSYNTPYIPCKAVQRFKHMMLYLGGLLPCDSLDKSIHMFT